MKQNQLLPISMKVIFLETWSNVQPKYGWILSNTENKLQQHPYIVSIHKSNKNNNHINTDSNKDIYNIHKDLIVPYDKKAYFKLIKNNKKINSKKKDINCYEYNYYCLTNRVISYSKYRFTRLIKRNRERLKVLFSFLYNVIIIGTFYLLFGNIIKLYSNQYKKYTLRKQIKTKIEQMHPSSFYFNGDGPITYDDEIITKLHKKLDQANKEVEVSSLNLVTLLIAIISIVVSLLK